MESPCFFEKIPHRTNHTNRSRCTRSQSPTLLGHFRKNSTGSFSLACSDGREFIQLDDGWPESVEEQGLLLLVWRHQIRNKILKMCYMQSRRGVLRQKLLHTDAFTYRPFYAQTLLHTKLLHTEAFTYRSFYTHTLAHRCFYTQTLLHWHFYTQTFYPQKLLHTEAFTNIRFYTDAFTHRHFYTQTLLHTDTFNKERFTHRSFYTQKHLHAVAFTHKNFYTQSHRSFNT